MFDFMIDTIASLVRRIEELNADAHRAQVHNDLKATGYRLGLLVSSGQHPKVVYERIVR